MTFTKALQVGNAIDNSAKIQQGNLTAQETSDFLLIKLSEFALSRWKEKMNPEVLPVDMKKGMRNLPLRTRARKFCRVLPSKGNAPQTNTYKTTPKLCRTRTTGNERWT